MNKKPALSAEYVQSILRYDERTGVLFWKPRPDMPKQWNTRYADCAAGTVMRGRGSPYCTIRINTYSYYAHILAFLIVKNRLPNEVVDHIDGNGLNNKWDNLRECTQGQNLANSRPRTNSISKLKGAHFNKTRNKWQASITFNGEVINLGRHDTAESAHAAYASKALELYGEYARIK